MTFRSLLTGLIIVFAIICWIANATVANSNTPSPFEFWDDYGFKVGEQYIVHPANQNPFSPSVKVDTLTVTGIIDDYVQFNDGSTVRFSSIGIRLRQYTHFKQ